MESISNVAEHSSCCVIVSSVAAVVLALLVSAICLSIIGDNALKNLLYTGGGLKPEVVTNLWSTAKWSGISAGIGAGVFLTSVTAYLSVHGYINLRDYNLRHLQEKQT